MENLSIEKLKIQKEKIGVLKSYINRELKKMTTLENNDLTLIAKFNNILDSAISSKWIGYDLIEEYISDVNKMKKDSAISVVAYTILVDIFKDKLLSNNKKVKDTISSVMVNSFIPLNSYEKIGSVLLSDISVSAIEKSNKSANMLSHCLDDVLLDVDDTYSRTLLEKDVAREFSTILKNEQEPISNTILEENDYEIMKLYFALKDNADHIFALTDDALPDDTYDTLLKIKKYRNFSSDVKNRLYEVIKKIDNNDINYFKKFNTILTAINIFDDIESKEKIVTPEFNHKK